MSQIAADVARTMVMAAHDFDKLTDQEIDNLPILPLVVARCAPQTKVRMIEALHRRKAFVGMTGDGVNDSPSLKRADVGIAMGQAGSDVAKEASDIVLTDDNFASILNAVEEGRRMFDNIQKFILHVLAENIAQACTLLIGLAFKDSRGISVFPLAPVQILWIIMITSGMPDMGLGFEIAAPDVMQRPPQNVSFVCSTPCLQYS
jgi:potassium/sodium efflux P-type ATPase